MEKIWIRDKHPGSAKLYLLIICGSGMEKIWIRDKHPGSAKLYLLIICGSGSGLSLVLHPKQSEMLYLGPYNEYETLIPI